MGWRITREDKDWKFSLLVCTLLFLTLPRSTLLYSPLLYSVTCFCWEGLCLGRGWLSAGAKGLLNWEKTLPFGFTRWYFDLFWSLFNCSYGNQTTKTELCQTVYRVFLVTLMLKCFCASVFIRVLLSGKAGSADSVNEAAGLYVHFNYRHFIFRQFRKKDSLTIITCVQATTLNYIWNKSRTLHHLGNKSACWQL